jgi:hypothetical protein
MRLDHIQVALFAAYDIRNALSKEMKKLPADRDGTEYTLGESIDDVIAFLETLEAEVSA